MQTRHWIAILTTGALSACAAPVGHYPSLAPRATEAIDPRVPIPSEVVVGPADANLSAHLAAMIDQAQAGDSAFRNAATNAERLAQAAGSRQSEGWIAAQQALSVAHAARAPTTRAMGDIDALAATALERQGGLPPGNLAAIREAAATVSTIDASQSTRLEAIEGRLGL